MKILRSKFLAVALCVGLVLNPLRVFADDIDIFVGSSAGSHDNPNVLIVLDNTSNWARQSQQWPGGEQQGQSEADAIKSVLSAVNSDVNVGLFSFNTEGAAADTDGGKVRFHISPMSDANKTSLSTLLTGIYNDINGVTQKRSSNAPYGYLMYDVYNYLSGRNAYKTPAHTLVDANGYTTAYSKFKSPLAAANSCAKNYVIFISNPNSSGPSADAGAGTLLAGVGGSTSQLGLPNFTSVATTVTSTLGETNKSGACYASAAACTTAQQTYASSEFQGLCATNDGTPPTYATAGGVSTCSCGSAVVPPGACAAGTQRYSVIGTLLAGNTNLGYTSGCYSNTSACSTTDYAAQCTGTGISCACSSSTYTTDGCSGSKKKFMVVKTRASTSTTNLGYTTGCYATQGACSTADYAAQCAGYDTCACSTPTTNSSSCTSGSNYQVTGTNIVTTNTPNGTYSTDTATYNADEWARHLYQVGVPVTGGSNQTVSTYTIDVYNAQPNATHTALMMSMARAGGGKYFNATNKSALVNALKQIFAEIVSVNTTFASASLPVNATNRTQNENQVFIGMFRPDPEAKPRWYGNLKRYQLALGGDGINVILADKNGLGAVNDQTGFITDCAVSFWTTDSANYWQNYPVNPSPAGTCTAAAAGGGSYNDADHLYSDLPDGPRVEKGAVAEILRRGNTSTPGAAPYSVNRTIYVTESNTSLALTALSSATTLSTTTRDWALGKDVMNENSDTNLTETRASIHGDVVHSRPLPINYGSGAIVVYYGANDGMLRAVDANTGVEKWAFLPYEFHARLDRLVSNSPLINYPNVSPTITPTPTKKDYFWDGSIGVFQNADNSSVWIFPTMRRGGRSVYALDVTNANVPSIKWRVGCPNLTNDTDCTGGMEGIGQTWSMPNVAPVKGYSTTNYLLVMGGGYDTCEDTDSAAPPCGAPKGAAVYILDAGSGSLVRSFTTTRSVVGDIAVVDIDGDGFADYGYALDTGGNVYRIDFVNRVVADDGTVTYVPLASGAWSMHKVAHTNGSNEGRKFLFAPAVVPTSPKLGKVYVAMGTGDREHPLSTQYPMSSVTNRFYVYMDDLSATANNNLDDASAMADYTIDPGCGGTAIVPTSSKKGWFMDLTNYGFGEQTVTSPLIIGGIITFSTNRPIPAAAGTCSSPLGEARGYWVNLLNSSGAIQCSGDNCTCGGVRSVPVTGGGLPPSPVMGTVPVGGVPTTVVIGAPQRGGGASSPISPQKAKPAISSVRKRVYSYTKGDN